MKKKEKQIYTIGHSTRKIDYFIEMLKSHGITMLVDVRTIPKSRAFPQFNGDSLRKSLEKCHIHYSHLPNLGGLRHTTKSSINTGWHNASFRGFADYMLTSIFWEGIKELEEIGKKYPTAIMCAEAVPWRCHRSLIADALTICHWKVFHITSNQPAKLHQLTPFLRIDQEGKIFYPE